MAAANLGLAAFSADGVDLRITFYADNTADGDFYMQGTSVTRYLSGTWTGSYPLGATVSLTATGTTISTKGVVSTVITPVSGINTAYYVGTVPFFNGTRDVRLLGIASAQLSTSLFTSVADTVNFNALIPTQLTAIKAGADLYNAQDGNDAVTLPTDALASVSGFSKTKSFDAGLGNDNVTAIDGTNTIYGGYGSDTLKGGSGNNYLYAGTKSSDALGFITPDNADNTLMGGSGFNVLDAWTNRPAAHDVLIGGSGTNYFYVQGNDEVKNFGAKDQINIMSMGRADQVNVLSDPKAGTTLVTIFEQNGSSYRTARVTIDAIIDPETLGVKAATVGGTSVVTITQTGAQTSDAAKLTQDFITSANNTIAFLRPLARAYYGYALNKAFIKPIVDTSVKEFTTYLLTAYAGTTGAGALQQALALPAVSKLFNDALIKILGDAVKGDTIGSAPPGDPTGTNAYTQWLSLAVKVGAVTLLAPEAALVTVTGVALTIGPAIIQAGFTILFQQLEASTQKLLDDVPTLKTFKFKDDSGKTTSIESPISTSARSDSYAFAIDDASGSYVVDPSGSSSYILASDAGTPALTSVVMPSLRGVGSYQVSAWTGTLWSAKQTIAPGQSLALPDGTSAIKVTSYDEAGTLTVTADPMLFTVMFAATGSFSGSVAVSPQSVGVYRFFDSGNGTHFLTSSNSERDAVLQGRPDLVYEGVGLQALDGAGNDPAVESVYRFFDTAHGTHFFTASLAERDAVIAGRADLTYEPDSTFFEHASQQPGDTPVYRFFDTQFGTHFYTSDAGERSAILATRADLVDEGIGFYAPT